MAKYIFAILTLITLNNQLIAQDKFVQLIGQVIHKETNEPISGVRVTNLNKFTMGISDESGWYTLVVSPGDKIQLSHLGMEHKYYTIPNEIGKRFIKNFYLVIKPYELDAVEINLPALEELEDYLMALDIDGDKDRDFALRHPDMFNVLDTIIAHEPKLLAFKNGKIESSPISYFYENVYKKIKEKMRKPHKNKELPKFKKQTSGEEKIESKTPKIGH